MKLTPYVLAKIILVLIFLLLIALQTNIGLADNGDYTRSMGWITTGPAGFEVNWPENNTKVYDLRFVNYWIPQWKLQWNLSNLLPIKTSAYLLWFPGALLNYLFISKNILFLQVLSLIPKIVLLGLLLLLFKWIDQKSKYRLFFLIFLGFFLVLLFTSKDYVVYFNTFYQETASFIFLFTFLGSTLNLITSPSAKSLVLSLLCLLFLTLTKASNIYWPIISIPFIVIIWSLKKKFSPRILLIGFLIIFIFTLLAFSIFVNPKSPGRPYTSYNSFFFGILTFSKNPAIHLHKLGFDEDALQCVNISPFKEEGPECFNKYEKEMNYVNTLRVIIREPGTLMKFIKHALDNMQKISSDYLGIYSLDDPRRLHDSDPLAFLNFWGMIKARFFPVGITLAVMLIVYLVWFVICFKKDFLRDFAMIGFFSMIACIFDLMVAILGDGKSDLVKHLFLSNVLFDIGTILFFASMTLFLYESLKTKSWYLNVGR